MLLPEKITSVYGITESLLQNAIEVCIRKTDFHMMKFVERYPAEYAVNGRYGYLRDGKGSGWLGFWGGLVWLSYLMTREKRTRFYGKRLTGYICSLLKEELIHSDLGFLVMPSCVADYRMTGSEGALAAVNMAARSLLEKYNAKSGVICSSKSENLNDLPSYKISNLLNIQVLVEANKFMGDDRFGEVAAKNLELICRNNIREDGRTGFRVLAGKDPRGVAVDDGETRAYAWALYGMAVCHATTGDRKYLERFEKVFQYLQAYKKDKTYYYEYLDGTANEGRMDSTSAAIVAAAFTEVLQNRELYEGRISGTDRWLKEWQEELGRLLNLLIFEYAAPSDGKEESILLGAEVFSGNGHRSTSTLCGDYFYMETLIRNIKTVESFWHVS